MLYVGKAKSLRNRVKSYFQAERGSSPKTRLMVSHVHDIDTIVTRTEKEAFILENNLIKQYRPRFNVVFRDDKEYPYLRLAVTEQFPDLTIVRKPKKDGSAYFGPFASSQAVRETLKALHKIFPIRKCSGKKKLRESRPCMYHQLGQCPAPCCRAVSAEAYRRTVKQVQSFLQGNSAACIRDLKAQMQQASENLEFEQAAALRDRIAAIETTLEKQSAVCTDFLDRDVFSLHRRGDHTAVTALFVRGGRMQGSRSAVIKKPELPEEEILFSYISQYYSAGEYIPNEIVVPLLFEDKDVLESVLQEKKGARARVLFPQRGFRKELLGMAARNAELLLEESSRARSDSEQTLKELQKRLHLTRYPFRIACFDISNISGTAAVGSMVLFENAAPCRQGYRKFKIKTVTHPDDYAMMHEALSRYLARAGDKEIRPDLILVDGGKGQLGVVSACLGDAEMTGIDAAALAKGPERDRAKRRQEEKVYIPGRKNPVAFPKNSAALFLLQAIRDEAHRFAVAYYQKVKTRTDLTSILESIPGVGPKTVKALLSHFGSLAELKQAPLGRIIAAPRITRPQAEAVHRFLHSEPLKE